MLNSDVMLVAANRFHYFQPVLESIVPQLEDRQLILILDEMGNNFIKTQHIELTKDLVPDAIIYAADKHMGLGKNMIKARIIAFEDRQSEHAFILEDDLILSPSYLTLTENMMEFCAQHFDNVGIVQAWSEQQGDPYQLIECDDHWWGYLQTKWSWDLIAPFLKDFEKKFLNNIPRYAARNHHGIMAWKMGLLPYRTSYGNPSRQFPATYQTALRKIKDFVTGQDGATHTAFYVTGQCRVATAHNRGLYIGETGEHYRPATYIKHGFHEYENFEGPEDDSRTTFSLEPSINIIQ